MKEGGGDFVVDDLIMHDNLKLVKRCLVGRGNLLVQDVGSWCKVSFD